MIIFVVHYSSSSSGVHTVHCSGSKHTYDCFYAVICSVCTLDRSRTVALFSLSFKTKGCVQENSSGFFFLISTIFILIEVRIEFFMDS